MVWSLIAGLFFIGIATGSLYTGYMVYRQGDTDGFWFFAAFGVFFIIFGLVFVMAWLSKKNTTAKRILDKVAGSEDEPQPVRFVPHWFMMSAVGICLLAIIIGVLSSIIRHFLK